MGEELGGGGGQGVAGPNNREPGGATPTAAAGATGAAGRGAARGLGAASRGTRAWARAPTWPATAERR